MKAKSETIVTAILIGCALVTTGLVARRELFPPPAAGPLEQKPVFLPDWKSYAGTGERLGPAQAPVQLIEFGDFECPFCGVFHQTLKDLRRKYPEQLAVTYIHYPLPMHRFAVPAARAAECARAQGRFDAMYDRLFEDQQSFGIKRWSDYASAAGVPDPALFESCISNAADVPRIEAGKQLATQLDIQGTPTVIVNGWRLGHPPTAAEIEDMIKAVLAGKEPTSGE